MTFGLAIVLGALASSIAVAGLFAPTQEGRELNRTFAGILAFWTILIAVIT